MTPPADADDISMFTAECGGYYDSAADGLASNFGALDIDLSESARPVVGISLCDRAREMARAIVRAMPGAARRRRADLSARFAGVIAIDRRGDR
jgi:hypothetical protein